MKAMDALFPHPFVRWSIGRTFRFSYVSDKAMVLGRNISLGAGSYVDDGAFIDATFGRVSIGTKCSIFRGAVIDPRVKEGYVRIGHQCWVEPYAVLFGQGGIEIGDDTTVSVGAKVLSYDHTKGARGVKIGRDSYVYAGAIVLPGVSIGDRAVVGAGAVVTKDVPSGETWVGNPAKRIA